MGYLTLNKSVILFIYNKLKSGNVKTIKNSILINNENTEFYPLYYFVYINIQYFMFHKLIIEYIKRDFLIIYASEDVLVTEINVVLANINNEIINISTTANNNKKKEEFVNKQTLI